MTTTEEPGFAKSELWCADYKTGAKIRLPASTPWESDWCEPGPGIDEWIPRREKLR
jgi:hypothetical protein